MSTQQRDKARSFFAYGIGFILAIALCFVLCSMEMLLGVCNDSTINRGLVNTSYKSKAYEEFCERSDEIFKGQGINIVTRNIFPKDETILQYVNYEKAILEGKTSTVNKKDIKEKIKKSISAAVDGTLDKINVGGMFDVNKDELDEIISYNSEQIAELYMKYMQPEFIVNIKESTDKLQNIMIITLVIALVVSVVLTTVLVFMFKHKERATKYIIAATMGSAMMSGIVGVFVSCKLKISNFGLAQGAYKEFISNYIADIKILFAIGPLMMVVVTAILGYMFLYKKKSKRK